MSSTSDLLTEIAGYEWLLAKVEAYRTDYASSDAEVTIAIIRHCIARKQQEISQLDIGATAAGEKNQPQWARNGKDFDKAAAAAQTDRN